MEIERRGVISLLPLAYLPQAGTSGESSPKGVRAMDELTLHTACLEAMADEDGSYPTNHSVVGRVKLHFVEACEDCRIKLEPIARLANGRFTAHGRSVLELEKALSNWKPRPVMFAGAV